MALTNPSWASLYTNDLFTRTSIPSHTGTTWFDDADAERKTVRYLASLTTHSPVEPPDNASQGRTGLSRLSRTRTSFLDLGTGNGSQLFALRKAGWTGCMVGVDYEPASVELARRIWTEIVAERSKRVRHDITGVGGVQDDSESSDEDYPSPDDQDGDSPEYYAPSTNDITFEAHDILSQFAAGSPPTWLPSEGFDAVLDKGTFDAISLSSELDDNGKRPCERYSDAVRFLVKRGGMLLVTSCNWTEGELQTWLCQPGDVEEDDRFEVCGRVSYPRFKFGGVEGQTVVGVVFKRR